MKKLKTYLKTTKVKQLAKNIGVTQQTVYNWLKGATIPNVKQALILDKATQGQVSVYSWL